MRVPLNAMHCSHSAIAGRLRCPAFLLQKMADQIIDVEPLHHHHDGVPGLVVETGEQGVGVY